MFDVRSYLPDVVRKWVAPKVEVNKTPEQEIQEPVQVAEYIRQDPDGSERHVRLMYLGKSCFQLRRSACSLQVAHLKMGGFFNQKTRHGSRAGFVDI